MRLWPFRNKAPARSAQELEALLVGAMHDHQAGRWQEAEHAYRQVLARAPEHADALHFLGVLQLQRGRHAEAELLISRALRVQAANPPAHHNLGLALLAQGRTDLAAGCFRKALELAPDHQGALVDLGNALTALGAHREAAALYRRALSAAPGDPDLHFSLGNAFHAAGDRQAAVGSYREAIRLRPAFPEAHTNLGSVLREGGQLQHAVASYRDALAHKPEYIEALYNLGIALRELGRCDDAATALRQAIALRPDFAPPHYGLGHVLCEDDRHAQALESFRRAMALDPGFVEARWSHAMTQVPAVQDAAGGTHSFRSAFDAELRSLDSWFEPSRVMLGERAVGAAQPFRLAYQDADNRELLARYGGLCARLMGDWQRQQGLAPRAPRAPGPVRVGVVSQFFRDHSVWNAIVKGWFQQLDRERFALHVFCLGAAEDDETGYARSRAVSFVQGAGGLRQWADAILAAQPDVLIYPEIGMDPMSLKLASLRLAPVQAASWGHPETTGLPTIDAYLSAQGLEPDGAQAHYTERLVALPNLGCYLQAEPVEPAPPDLASLGLENDVPLLLCPGTPFKYAPEHDQALVEIARRLGRCQLVFFEHRTRALSEKLRARLAAAFGAAGLDFDSRVRFIPWQTRQGFYGLLGRADVFLDTIGFSGFNTALQAVQSALPIVTREGRFLRGRLASGILKRIGLHELVAGDDAQYIDLAVRLVQDRAWREDIRRRIVAGRPLLYEDPAPAKALEAFLAQGV